MRFAGSVMIRYAKQDALRSFSEGGPVPIGWHFSVTFSPKWLESPEIWRKAAR